MGQNEIIGPYFVGAVSQQARPSVALMTRKSA